MNSDATIFLSSPHFSGTEQRYIQEYFDANRFASVASNLDGFEVALQSYLSTAVHVAALNSGTAAIHLGLLLLGVEAGDMVICQTMTFSASVNPVLYLGAQPLFVDSEIETWNLCPVALEKAIIQEMAKGKKPKAIIAVHLYGVPYQVEAIRAVAKVYGIPILEDAAEALGSSYKGQKCGTFGDLSALSFNTNKIITTSGGGALVVPTPALKDRTLFLASQSKDAAAHYQHSEIGYNYRMSSVCAGIGRGQMEVLEDLVNLRRAMHDFYATIFKDIDGVMLFTVPNADYFANYWLSAILIDSKKTNGMTRETIRLALEAENIESRPLWKPMHLQPIFQKYPYYGEKVAETLFDNGLCLPSGSNLTEEDRNRIKSVLLNLLVHKE